MAGAAAPKQKPKKVTIDLPRFRPDQWRIVSHPAKVKVCAMGRRWGKLLPLDTPIPTPLGWTTMGGLREGSAVFDDRGSPCVVTAVSEIDLAPNLFRIKFHDGTEIVADENHQWLTWDRRSRKYNGRQPNNLTTRSESYSAMPSVRTTAQIRATISHGVSQETNHAIQLCGYLQYPEKDLLVDPYTLGAWLGDGDTSGPYITGNDEDILAHVAAAGYPVRELVHSGGRGHRWSLTTPPVGQRSDANSLRSQLREIAVLGNKHIPREYLESSLEQREELLKGLMDTDGSVESTGRCRFEVMHERLANDVLELVTSLGYLASFRTKRAILNHRDVGTVYRVSFTPTRSVFNLERKYKRQHLDTGMHSRFRFITSVEPVESRPGRCIQVDSPSHCYLAGRECLVTHNSTMVGGTIVATASQGGRCAIGAPSYRNTRPMWRWAENAVRPLVDSKLAVINRAEKIIEFPSTGGFLGVYTLDNPDSMRGEAFHLVAIDEAARVSEEAWTDVIQPTLADYDGEAFLISTPRGRNWFWKEWQAGQQDGKYIKSWTAPSSDNPIPAIRAAAEKAKLRVPENTYNQEWLAMFVDDAMVYFSPEWWDGINRYDPRVFRHANTCIARFMSWDTGFKDKEGNAYSACIVVDLMPDYRLQVREVFRERLNFPDLIARIMDLAHKYEYDDKTRAILIEDRASGTSAYQTIIAGSDNYSAALVQPWMPSGSKEQRAAQAGVWCKNGSVMLPLPAENVPWLYTFEEELYATPHSLYKDQCDAFSQVVIYLEHLLQAGFDARRMAMGPIGTYSDLVRATAMRVN